MANESAVAAVSLGSSLGLGELWAVLALQGLERVPLGLHRTF